MNKWNAIKRNTRFFRARLSLFFACLPPKLLQTNSKVRDICCLMLFSPTITNVSFKYIFFKGHFGFQKKRTVKYGLLNWPIIALELTEWYDNRTYSELIALLYQLRYITLSLTIQNFFSTRSRNLTCTCGRPAKLLLITCTGAYSY